MSKYFFIFIILISSCKSDEVKYYNHEKWKWTTNVMGWWYYETVKGKPIEVKEIFYDSIMRDRQDLTEFPAYEIRKFNRVGDVVYEEQVYRDSTHFIRKYTYNDLEMQMKEYAVHKAARWGFDENDTGRISTELMKDGKFKIKTYNASAVQPNPSYSLVTFLNNGRKVIVEELFPRLIQDTTNNLITFIGFSDSMEISDTCTKEYDEQGDIIQDGHVDKFGEGYTFIYYYDKNKFLDSIIEKEKDSSRLSESYSNNKYGDPIKSKDATYEYNYDSKQNWIKRIAKYKNGTLTVIREIKY